MFYFLIDICVYWVYIHNTISPHIDWISCHYGYKLPTFELYRPTTVYLNNLFRSLLKWTSLYLLLSYIILYFVRIKMRCLKSFDLERKAKKLAAKISFCQNVIFKWEMFFFLFSSCYFNVFIFHSAAHNNKTKI